MFYERYPSSGGYYLFSAVGFDPMKNRAITLAVVPRGTPHALGNHTKQAVHFLNSGNPAGFERFFADIETTARRLPYGSPEFFAELMSVYKRYDTEMLGPAPQG